MESFQVLFSKQVQKDIALRIPKQKEKFQQVAQQILAVNPYAGKALKGELKGLYFYRLNLTDRIVYEILEADKVVFVIGARTHYGD
ncbi:MAG: type II toxin-antitoxin system YoeB family toxin [Stenomitos rutilans HA7619-LM2]|jgi:Txe/YoeB family toxin of Txe-Axe toxin-antitoxin module|nr:type II toxin-antitoxin system YoeB family toxin [Stenomitos rutilans HA7619-LM2]